MLDSNLMVVMVEGIVAKLVTIFLKNRDAINMSIVFLVKRCFRDMIPFKVLSYSQLFSSFRFILMQLPLICPTFANTHIHLIIYTFRSPKNEEDPSL